MDFSFNETQQEVQQLAQKILSEMANQDRLNKIDQQDIRFDQSLWDQLAESGLLGVAIDENHSGMGFGFTELCLFIEEVGKTVAPVPVVPVLVGAAMPIQAFGSAEQKAQWLPAIASGTTLVTSALVESFSQQAQSTLTTLQPQGNDFVLNGSKIAVAFAAQAKAIVVNAQLNGQEVLLILEPTREGVTLQAQDSTTYEPWYQIDFDQVKITQQDILSQDAEAASWVADRVTTALCALQTGVVDAAMKTTAEFTCERVQFDVPIGSFQAVQHRAADCFIDHTCLKLTTYQAVSLLDADKSATNEVLIAKIWAGDTGHRVSYAAQHLHGGTGIDKDYHLWRYCLLARQNEMLFGSSAFLLSDLGERIAEGKAYAE